MTSSPGFAVMALALLGAAACTTTQATNRPDGNRDFVIACGAGLGWNICYDRANEVCPSGYKTVSREGGFNRKELTISCPNAPAQALQTAYRQCTYETSLATAAMRQDREATQGRLFQQCMAAKAAVP